MKTKKQKYFKNKKFVNMYCFGYILKMVLIDNILDPFCW